MSTPGTKILLETKDLAVGYSTTQTPLFENLNLQLYEGELICFMGPNGVGKSTLIRTLAGLQKATRGAIRTDTTTDLQFPIAVVLTDKVSTPGMSVYELITFGRYPYLDWNIRLQEDDKRIIDEAIELVHIQDILQKKLYQLSDGQLQMVMIARALAQTTPIILLDEPTAHLDLNNRVEIMRLLRNLAHKNKKAILVATHELDLALQTADYIWLTGKEKNVIPGIPEDLVLNGSFDEIFQFKGFDLKTGKMTHEAHRNKLIHLVGEGFEYLWTKNALERNGFAVTPGESGITIKIELGTQPCVWVMNNQRYTSIQGLLKYLCD
ncbi:ABC transporter ATP-binding protein [Ohtaekwangia koreensis]|uniref:Iron complex transport system ATP-binding protein n=1 Tax=Ohtaekwangia koreensis TaxID=688867 RepID=A0A1T5MJE0_9BACT|nr:ABC transporter ATP-binding protein [Ohtaekwangia koreensis]SKC88350.1 iron complex transport system ATP-binding protein [Ohtaekwangia koreensis]